MILISATFVINESIPNIGVRQVGTTVITREVEKLPVKFSWLEEEAKKYIDKKYQLGCLISISNLTDLIDFSK